MYFLVIAHDVKDEEAAARRAEARAAHAESIHEMVQRGQMVCGGSLLDDKGERRGAAVFVNFPDREQVDQWLAREPYVLGNVWERVEIMPVTLVVGDGKILP